MPSEKKQDMLRWVQIAANLAVAVAAGLLCVVLVKNYLIPRSQPATTSIVSKATNSGKDLPTVPYIQSGTKLSLAGIDWGKTPQTLLLVVSATCHYCSESAPFYKRLEREHGRTQLVAVLPQPLADGKKYLDSLSVRVDEVKQAALNSLGVRGTPTLILVDSNGVVVNSWIGKLDSKAEMEVVNSLEQGGSARN